MPATALGKPITPILQPGGIATGLGFGAPVYEGGGTTLHDLSGNGNDGIFSGGVTWADGAFGRCLSFDGSTGLVEVASTAGITATTGFTIAAWIYPRSFPGYQVIAEGQSASAQTDNYSLFLNSSGQLTSYSGSNHIDGTGTVLSLNQWSFGAVTFDGATLTTWLNGRLDSTAASTQTSFLATKTRIGARASGILCLDGQLDAIFLYPRGLSAGEVAVLYADSFILYRQPSRIYVSSSSTVSGAGTADGVATATGVGASTDASAGSASGVATASGVGASTVASAGTADGSATASAVGASTALSAGTANGAATASAVGASTAASAGTADGVATALGVATGTAPAAGAADGAATAAGVGVGIASAVGTATGTATVAGNGASVAAALGTASGTSTAVAVSNNAPVVVCPPTPFAVSTSRTGAFGCSTSALDYVNGSTSATGSFLVGC